MITSGRYPKIFKQQATIFQHQPNESNYRYKNIVCQYKILSKEHKSLSNKYKLLSQEFAKSEQDKITFYNQVYGLHKHILHILCNKDKPWKLYVPYRLWRYYEERLEFTKEQIAKGTLKLWPDSQHLWLKKWTSKKKRLKDNSNNNMITAH